MKNDSDNPAASTSSRMKRKSDYKKNETRSWILSLLAALVVALLLRFFVFEFIRVEGDSMNQTLHDDEYVFMERVTYWMREPEFGDIIICTYPDMPNTYVKRVIGTGGDTIEVKDGVLYINGEPDHQDYAYFGNRTEHNGDFPAVVVPQDCVFVMGDNRNQSMDSRSPHVGALPYERVLGKALFVIWPPENMGGL